MKVFGLANNFLRGHPLSSLERGQGGEVSASIQGFTTTPDFAPQ